MKEPINEKLIELLDIQFSKNKLYIDEIDRKKAEDMKQLFIRDAHNALNEAFLIEKE